MVVTCRRKCCRCLVPEGPLDVQKGKGTPNASGHAGSACLELSLETAQNALITHGKVNRPLVTWKRVLGNCVYADILASGPSERPRVTSETILERR